MIHEYFKELNNLNEDIYLDENFQIHTSLNSKLFDIDDNIMFAEVRQRLVEIADLFVQNIKENDIPIKVYDYWLVGSNAAYNYTPESDIDIHIIVDTNIVTDVNILRMLYDYIKSSYSQKYNIKVKGHEVELYLEDIQTTAITNGIYSIMKDEWIKVPEKPDEDITIDIENNPLFIQWLANYEKLKDEECEQFLDDLYYLRKVSLSSEGEFGEGNLIFKEFRNRGYIQNLKDRKYQAESHRLTLESLNEDILCEKQWIEAEATDGKTTQNFAFYATDKNPTADLNTLLPIINGTQTGTYKQSLDKDILSTLKTLYKNNPSSFTLKMIKLLGNSAGTIPRITLMDRDLRKEASDIANNALMLTPTQKTHITSNSCDKIYVHHINKHEDDNTFNNLLLIGYPAADLGYANAVHQIAHNNKATPPVQLIIGSKILPYIDCSTGHNGTVEFIIT